MRRGRTPASRPSRATIPAMLRRLLGAHRASLGNRRRLWRLQRILDPSARADRIRQCPDPLVAAPDIIPVGLRRVAVDEASRIERMGHAADLVLDREQHLAAVEIDDVLEAVLAAIALFGDQVELAQFLVRPAKIRYVDLDVVAVIFGKLLVGFAEDEFLLRADRDVRRLAAAIGFDLGMGAEDLLVEAGDALDRP